MSTIVCPCCSSGEFEQSGVDKDASINVCCECGAVIEEEVTFTHDPSSSNFSGSFANADGSRKYGNGFNILQALRLPGESPLASERKLINAFGRVCSKLQIRSGIIEEAKSFLLEKANTHKYFKATHNKTCFLVGSSIYVVCNINSVPITIKQIANACDCSGYGIWAMVRRMERVFDVNITPVTVQGLLGVTCSHLENSKACEEMANEVYAQSSETMIHAVESPLTKAIAYAVIAAINVNRGTTEKRALVHLCEKMCATQVNVIRCLGSLKRFMKSVLPEIPWVDMKYVKKKNIHFYIKDIMKYRKNFGAFQAESEDPKWFSKRQEPYVARQEKIKKAQERIKLKQGPEDGTERLEKLGDNTELDKDDEIIEELLEMGCTPKDIQYGFYDSLRTMSTGFEILDEEIDSYVRTPEEVRAIQRITDNGDDDEHYVRCKRRKLVEEFE